MRKPTFCIYKNKSTDQLGGNHGADQCIVLHYIYSTIPLILNLKFQASSHLLWLYSSFVVDLVRNTKDRLSHDVAHTEDLS